MYTATLNYTLYPVGNWTVTKSKDYTRVTMTAVSEQVSQKNELVI